MSSTSASGFKWLDFLEKEFDKSFVSIDHSARSISDEYELEEVYDTQRKLLSNLGNCFVQLVHKSQTIFQVNAKLEAELINAKENLANYHKSVTKIEAEKSYLLCLLQSCLLENSLLKSKDPNIEHEKLAENVQLKLANDLAALQRVDWASKFGMDERIPVLDLQNQQLKKQIADLESELVGARLDAKYLDKELAGRIQQIQILLASNASQEHKQQVWAQIEAEMHLQRSKTIANMCYSKQKLRDQQISQTISEKSEEIYKSNGHASTGTGASAVISVEQDQSELPSSNSASGKKRIKQVHLHKHDADELGMAILGGLEHGLPIIISEVFPNSAVGRCKKIYAGDVILGVNGDSFTDMGHHDAVKYLSALRGSIRFDLENAIEADIDEVCDMDTRFYQFHITETEQDSSDANQTRTQPQRMSLSHPGKAKDIRSTTTSTTTTDPSHNSINKNLGNVKKSAELPRVHSSPSKLNSLNAINTEKTEEKIEAIESADTKTTSSAGDTATESTTETAEPKMPRTVAL